MKNKNEGSHSLWMDERLPSFPALEEDVEADVCIVGAGIVGLTCAYTLSKQGKSVIIIDKDPIAGGQTPRTTAHLTWVLDDRFFELENLFGYEGAKLAAESHSAAIDQIEKIVTEEKIECDFERVDGYLFLSPDESPDLLKKEFIAISRMGKEVYELAKAPISSSFDTGPCLHMPHQGQFHIFKYLKGLIGAIQKRGGKIFFNTHANKFEDATPCITTTENGAKIRSKWIIVATDTPVNNRFFIHSKQSAYRTYVIAASIPKGTVEKGLYWDTKDPYHYIRLQKHPSDSTKEWLIIGGEDHKTGQEKEIQSRYEHLESWSRKHFPMIDAIEYHWSGQVFEPVDSLGLIGLNPGDKNIYIATGDSGNGMTNGTIAGMLIRDLIEGAPNPWQNLYTPSRKTMAAALTYIHENLNVAAQYADWLTPGDKEKIENLKNNEGLIVRQGAKKLAVYKDENGDIHINSALCPHLGGCVHWNSGEKSWDCPCHGSRFNGCGKVINGPAISDLQPE